MIIISMMDKILAGQKENNDEVPVKTVSIDHVISGSFCMFLTSVPHRE